MLTEQAYGLNLLCCSRLRWVDAWAISCESFEANSAWLIFEARACKHDRNDAMVCRGYEAQEPGCPALFVLIVGHRRS